MFQRDASFSNDKTLPPQGFRSFLIGQSPLTRQLCDVIQLIAARRVTVLISGETGTGKEVVARAIHAASNRAGNPMVAVNCTALPANLVESELFGHVKGAFTGADRPRMGRFEQANRGTIFLDEIGDLPMESQGKLLRVLQEQEFERIGSSESVRVDVRVIAATNVMLEEAVKDRRFREDLFYRLNVVPIHITPLRERREDIPLLLQHFLEKVRSAERSQPKTVSQEAIDYLVEQAWPGNVRQLEHTVQMAFALSGHRERIELGDFSPRTAPAKVNFQPVEDFKALHNSGEVTLGEDGLDFDEVVQNLERSLLQQALTLSGGNKAKAADLLRIKRTTLLAKMKTFEDRRCPIHAPTPIRPLSQEEFESRVREFRPAFAGIACA